MIKFALLWFDTIGVNRDNLVVRLKLYKDTDTRKIIKYWSNILGLKEIQFRFHIKESNQSGITYKNGFGYGTCSIVYWNRDKGEYIMQSLRYLKNYFL